MKKLTIIGSSVRSYLHCNRVAYMECTLKVDFKSHFSRFYSEYDRGAPTQLQYIPIRFCCRFIVSSPQDSPTCFRSSSEEV